MTLSRVKGYVVGYDKANGELLWTVHVKDPTSAHDGRRFVVHSTSGPTITRPAVDVTFKVEPVQVEREFILKAIDVRISKAAQVEQSEEKLSPSKPLETLNLAVTKMGDQLNVWVTGCDSRKAAEKELESDDERVVAFLPFDIYDHVSQELIAEADIPEAFEIIRHLAYWEQTRDALEKLLTAVYVLGHNTNTESRIR